MSDSALKDPKGAERWDGNDRIQQLGCCSDQSLILIDLALAGLQRSRIVLHKLRMADHGSTIRDQLFSSLGDAAQLLRLFDFLPNVLLCVKDTPRIFDPRMLANPALAFDT